MLYAFVAFLSVTDIFINSVSFTELTVILSLNSSSVSSIPKFEITCLVTFLLFTNSLYVDTNLEFNVISLVVIVLVLEFALSDVANNNVVEDVYLGVTNPTEYIIPISIKIIVISIILTFLSQNNITNSFKSISSIFLSPFIFRI